MPRDAPPGGDSTKVLLPPGKKLPVKRAVKYANLTGDGFDFTLSYNASGPHGLPPGVTDPLLARYKARARGAGAARHAGAASK